MDKKHHGSVFQNEQKLLNTILEIHNDNEPLQLDPMFNKGSFYKSGEVQLPELRYDLNPQGRIEQVMIGNENYGVLDWKGQEVWVEKASATELPILDSAISSMILDPPFMFRTMNKSKLGANIARYTVLKDYNELETLYKGIIKEAHRVLKNKGLLIFKCQDYTNTKTTMTHCLTYQWLQEAGFYVKDLAILDKKWKITNPKTTQRHLRKTHTYFWIAIKKGGK